MISKRRMGTHLVICTLFLLYLVFHTPFNSTRVHEHAYARANNLIERREFCRSTKIQNSSIKKWSLPVYTVTPLLFLIFR